MTQRALVIGVFCLFVWVVAAWVIDTWYATASLFWVTMAATAASFVLATIFRPPLKTVCLGYAVTSAVLLVYKLLAYRSFDRPGRLLGYLVLPVDMSYYRRDLGDALTIWFVGFIGAIVAYYVFKQRVRTASKTC